MGKKTVYLEERSEADYGPRLKELIGMDYGMEEQGNITGLSKNHVTYIIPERYEGSVFVVPKKTPSSMEILFEGKPNDLSVFLYEPSPANKFIFSTNATNCLFEIHRPCCSDFSWLTRIRDCNFIDFSKYHADTHLWVTEHIINKLYALRGSVLKYWDCIELTNKLLFFVNAPSVNSLINISLPIVIGKTPEILGVHEDNNTIHCVEIVKPTNWETNTINALIPPNSCVMRVSQFYQLCRFSKYVENVIYPLCDGDMDLETIKYMEKNV